MIIVGVIQMDSHGDDGALSSGEEDEGDGDSHTHHTTHPNNAHHSHHAHGTGGASVAPSYGNQSNGVGQGNLNVSFRGAPSVSGGQSVAPPSAAAYGRRAPAQATAQEFIIQLATTRKMLLSVLEKHDAVPDKVLAYLVCLKLAV